MGKAVLMSIQPKWIEKIASGEKTIEVRKSLPKLETPFKVYIYCTKEKRKDDFITISGAFGLIRCPECAIYNRAKEYDGNGKVIGEFVCDRIDEFIPTDHGVKCKRFTALHETRLTVKEMREYLQEKTGYGWHISDLKIYDKPKELSEFFHACKQPNGTDCSKCIDRKEKTCYSLKRPPQSWCYVEQEK